MNLTGYITTLRNQIHEVSNDGMRCGLDHGASEMLYVLYNMCIDNDLTDTSVYSLLVDDIGQLDAFKAEKAHEEAMDRLRIARDDARRKARRDVREVCQRILPSGTTFRIVMLDLGAGEADVRVGGGPAVIYFENGPKGWQLAEVSRGWAQK